MEPNSEPAIATVIYESHEEIKEPIETTITGEIPLWLDGTLLRNGPGKFEFGDTAFKHFFDGQALLHRFTIKEGRVQYLNKFLRSNAFIQNTERNTIMLSEFGTNHLPDPCKNVFERYFSYYFELEKGISDNALVNVIEMKNKFYAVTESPLMCEIDPESLDVLSRVNNSKDFPVPSSFHSATAHPHEEPDGTIYNYGPTRGRYMKYNIFMVPPKSIEDPNEKALAGGQVLCTIPVHSGEAFIHSFGMTENFFILAENPYMLSMPKVVSRLFFGWTFEECFYWEPSQPSRFYVIEKKSGKVVGVHTTNPMFVFHHVNAFEDGDHIVVDLVAYHDPSVMKAFYMHELKKRTTSGEEIPESIIPELRRYRIPLTNTSESTPIPKSQPLTNRYEALYEMIELPRINYEMYNGKPYEFVYGMTSMRQTTAFIDSLVKVNTKTKESKIWKRQGSVSSEPVFVAKPGAVEEDEGVVLSVVIDVREKKTFLLVLDGESFTEVGRAEVPFTTPFGFHGRFIPQAQ